MTNERIEGSADVKAVAQIAMATAIEAEARQFVQWYGRRSLSTSRDPVPWFVWWASKRHLSAWERDAILREVLNP